MKTINGRLEGFYEQGTEGVCWAVYEDGKTGYEGLYILKNGNHLVVWDENDAVVFDGIIDLEYESNWKPYEWTQEPHKPGYWCHGYESECATGHSVEWAQEIRLGRQIAGNWGVHGLQRGVDPNVWQKWFEPLDYKTGLGYRCKLVKVGK
jgi:hypothetical protein